MSKRKLIISQLKNFVARFSTNAFISFLYRTRLGGSQLVHRVERLSLASFFKHCKLRDKKNRKIGDAETLLYFAPTDKYACVIESLINFWNCSAYFKVSSANIRYSSVIWWFFFRLLLEKFTDCLSRSNPVFAGALHHHCTVRKPAYQIHCAESSAIYNDNFCSRTICTCCATMAAVATAAAETTSDVGDRYRVADASGIGPDDDSGRDTGSGSGASNGAMSKMITLKSSMWKMYSDGAISRQKFDGNKNTVKRV